MSVTSIKTALGDVDDTALAGMPDSFEDVHAGDHFITPFDEIIVADAVDIKHSAASSEVTLKYPERESYDEDGNEVPYAYTVSIDTLFAKSDADGGWSRIPPAVFTEGVVNCPRCGGFMNKHESLHDMPTAQCRCGCVKHYDDLEADGDVVPVLL